MEEHQEKSQAWGQTFLKILEMTTNKDAESHKRDTVPYSGLSQKFREILSRASGIAEEINLSPQEEREVISCLMDLTDDLITEYHAETRILSESTRQSLYELGEVVSGL